MWFMFAYLRALFERGVAMGQKGLKSNDDPFNNQDAKISLMYTKVMKFMHGKPCGMFILEN